jgi:hypothetical protein
VIDGDTLTITYASGSRGGATEVDGTWTRKTGGNGGGSKSELPETLTPEEAKTFFTDYYKTASDEDKEGFLILIGLIAMETEDEDLQAQLDGMGETPPNDLSFLPTTFWKALSDGWSDIKDMIEGRP